MNSLHSVLHRKSSQIRGEFVVSDLGPLYAKATLGPRHEYDCSENTNDAVSILAGARRTKREAKDASEKPILQK
jgi:hypothetical protein